MSKLIAMVALSMFAGSAAYAAGHWSASQHYWAAGNKSTSVSAPEIDPATSLSGLTLLAGGLAVLRGRRNRK
jgi:hypothetical protein